MPVTDPPNIPVPQRIFSAERQAQWAGDVLAHTQANLTLLTPLRDADGQVVDFGYLFTNPANARMTGRSVEDMLNSTLLTLFPTIGQTVFFEHLLRVVATGEDQRFLFPYQADGITGWFDISFIQQGDNVLFTSTDVTPLKQAELAQQQQNEWLTTLIDSSPMAICYFSTVRDPAGTLLDFALTKPNDVHAATLGGTVADVTGRRVLEHYPGSAGNGFYERLVRTVDTGEAQRFIIHYDVDGLDVWADVQMVRIDDGVLMSYLNISDIKNAEIAQQRQAELLAAANVELQRSNDHLQEFAYIASHDLQEPLRKIQSFSDVLRAQHQQDMSEQSLDILQRMRNAAERMSGLVADLLTYSRLHTKQEEITAVDLTALTQEVLQDLDLLVQESRATIRVGTLPVVKGNAGQLQQLLINLLTNALKYVAPNQSPVIDVNSCRIKADVVHEAMPLGQRTNMSKHTQYWEISVQDNGIGFNEKYLDRLFKMFQRLHNRSQYDGSGIGLAICKRVVDNHGGMITARSVPGEGSVFLVYLP